MVADRIDKLGRPGKEPGSLPHDATTQLDRLYFDTANAANPVVMDLSSGFDGCRFAHGLRNSHDKSFRLSCTIGVRVFVLASADPWW
jgi:hypothetical protein